MPGPHFNSKRLKNARNVRAEFAPGSVPRVGAPGFRLRLLPRTVEKNCGCHIPKPAAPAAPSTITITTAYFSNGSHIQDAANFWGTGSTETFWNTYGIEVGDTIVFIHPTTSVETTVAVLSMDTHSSGKIFKIYTTPAHGVGGGTYNVTITIPDRS
tara:strand:+ start:146 stop:613 length:468 start_codon:yes stop_codon:yes gene_type:complete